MENDSKLSENLSNVFFKEVGRVERSWQRRKLSRLQLVLNTCKYYKYYGFFLLYSLWLEALFFRGRCAFDNPEYVMCTA